MIHNRVEWHSFRSAAITTSGTITECSGGYSSRDGGEPAYSKYEFWVNGERFFGGSEKYISNGKSVMIAYLPNDPSRNDLADDKSGYKRGFWFATVVCIFSTWMFRSGLKVSRSSEFESTSFALFPLIVATGFSACLIVRSVIYPVIHEGALRALVIFTVLLLSLRAIQWGSKFMAWALVPLLIRYNPIIPIGFDSSFLHVFDLLSIVGLLSIVANLCPPSEIHDESR